MTRSSNLNLPLLAAAQSQKHVTLNEALIDLDGLLHISVAGAPTDDPPFAPVEGERWLIGDAPTGDWIGRAGQLAVRRDGGWRFHTPKNGWLAHDRSTGRLRVHEAGDWVEMAMPQDLQNLTRLGLGATADATNPLSAKLNNVLITALSAGEGGDGDLRVKMNKETNGDTASLLFQTGYSGRAEVGLAGDNDFHLKVSPNGSTWHEAMRIDRSTGTTSVKVFDSVQVIVPYESVVSVETPSNGGIVIVSVVASLYPQNGVSSLFAYDNGNSPLLTTMVLGAQAENLGTSTMTGTSGADGKVAFAVKDDGKLYIQNRFAGGAARQICLTFINSYRAI